MRRERKVNHRARGRETTEGMNERRDDEARERAENEREKGARVIIVWGV